MSFEEYQPHLFPKLEAIGKFVGGLLKHLPDSGYPSERGAAAMLDAHLDFPRSLPGEQIAFDYQAYEHPTRID